MEHRKPGGNGNNQHTAAAKKTVPEELCQFDTIPPTASEASVRRQIAERNNVSESYVARSEKFMRGVETVSYTHLPLDAFYIQWYFSCKSHCFCGLAQNHPQDVVVFILNTATESGWLSP